MKIAAILLFFVPSIFFAQTNLMLENGKVVWQKVYNVETTPSDYKNQLLQSLNFQSVDIVENTIYTVVRDIDMDYKSLGKGEMTTSMYLSRANYDAIAMIEFKDDRFRVTVRDLKAIQIYSDGLFEKGEMHPLEFWAVNRKGEFKKYFLKNDAEIIDFTLDKLFYPHKIKKDDW